jgi:type VI secretion system secreted protein Hcp
VALSKIAKLMIAVPALAAAVVASPHTADAAGVDASVQIDGIAGEGTGGAIALTAYHLTATDRGGGKLAFKDITIGHAYDAASPNLALAAGTNKLIGKAVFSFRRGAQHQTYLTVTIYGVRVQSLQDMASAAGGEVPVEQVALAFEKIEWNYRPLQNDGSLGAPVKACWDVRAEKPC